VLREALRYYGAGRSVTLSGFIDLLSDLPDDVSGISNLYPTALYLAQTGTISGVLRLKDGVTQYSGINVIARNVADPVGDAVSDMTGSATQPLVNNRLTGIVAGPIDRAIDRLALRGQKRVNDWIELGRTQEPSARRMARETYENVFDEFIGLLAENQELADLVQKKSMGLATEAVDEFRSRTVSADALAEKLVRRILRRPMREDLLGSSGDGRVTAEGE